MKMVKLRKPIIKLNGCSQMRNYEAISLYDMRDAFFLVFGLRMEAMVVIISVSSIVFEYTQVTKFNLGVNYFQQKFREKTRAGHAIFASFRSGKPSSIFKMVLQ